LANPFADVLRGYADLGSTLIQKWGEHASGVASRVGSGGPYGPDCASADLAKTAMLAADSGMLMASEALDCFAMLTGRSNAPLLVESDAFPVSKECETLTLAGPLVNCYGSDTLPESAIEIRRASPKQLDFNLRADAGGHEAGTYFGEVLASTTGAAQPEHVTVWITVP